MIDFVALGIEQARIDSEQTSTERNRLGQFATPLPLALEIATAVAKLIPTPPRRFLEPSLGLGNFYAAYRQVFGNDGDVKGIELDARIVRSAFELWNGTRFKLIQADFTTLPPPLAKDRFDLILANPPYVRHHHLDKVEKARLQALVRDRLGIKVSGLTTQSIWASTTKAALRRHFSMVVRRPMTSISMS